LFLFGKIDQDFFSFYYIGRGVANGAGMYQDFADNKGPVLYIFFATLYKIFGKNYLTALIFSSTLIDGLSLFAFYLFLKKNFNVSLPKNILLQLFFIIFTVAFYKSFSIGSFMGGFYAETLGVMFIVSSILFLVYKRYFISGVAFSLAFLCRLTLFFWIIYLFYLFLSQKPTVKKFLYVMCGFFVPIAFFLAFFLIRGSLQSMLANVFFFNLSYATSVKFLFFMQIKSVIFFETRIIVSLIFSLIILLLMFKNFDKKTVEFGYMFFSGVLASFVGGLFYFHHYVQFSLIFLFLIFHFNRKYDRKLGAFFIFLTSILLIINYSLFFKTSKLFSNSDVEYIESLDNEYIQVVSYYPELYIRSGKYSFDRYYQVFQLSSFYNTNSSMFLFDHLNSMENYSDKIAFVFVEINDFDIRISDEYRKFMEENKYYLEDVFQKSDAKKTISIYEIEE